MTMLIIIGCACVIIRQGNEQDAGASSDLRLSLTTV